MCINHKCNSIYVYDYIVNMLFGESDKYIKKIKNNIHIFIVPIHRIIIVPIIQRNEVSPL